MSEMARRILYAIEARKMREEMINKPKTIVQCLLCERVTSTGYIEKTNYLIRQNKVDYLCNACTYHVSLLGSLCKV